MRRHVAVLLLLAACPAGSPSSITPTLPGDGTAHVAQPTDPTKGSKDDPWAGRTDLITAPAAQPPAKLDLPEIQRFTLPNGLAVMVIPDAHLPLVSMQMAVRAGRGDEPHAKLGVAEFEKVTAADVERVVKKYMAPERATVVVIPPKGS